MVSPGGAVIATSTMRAPARSSVIVRSRTAEPPFTWARPEASTAGGPSSRSSRAVTVSSSHARPPAHPISTRSGRGAWATAAPAAVTRRTLASAGVSFVVAIAWIGTPMAAPRSRRLASGASSGGSSSLPSLTTTSAAGLSSEEAASARRAAPRSLWGALAVTASPSEESARGKGGPSPNPSTTMRASGFAFWSLAIARSRCARRERPLSPRRAIDRDVSARTTTRAPTVLSRAEVRAGRRAAATRAVTASSPDTAMTGPPRWRRRISTSRRTRLARASAQASPTAHGGRSALGPTWVESISDGPRASSRRASRPTPHEPFGVDLVVLVVGAQDVHGDVHGQPNRALSLQVAAGPHGLLPHSGWASGECAAAIVLAEEDLRLAAMHDGIERRRALDAALGAPQQIERAKDDVVRSDRDGCAVRQDARDLAACASPERARLPSLSRSRVIDEEDASEGEEATERRYLGPRQRSDFDLTAPVEKGSLDDGRVIRSDDARPETRGRAGTLHEL